MTAKTRTPGRVRADARTSVGAAVALLLVIIVAESAAGDEPQVVSMLVIPPFIAAPFAQWRSVAGIGAACLVAAIGTVFYVYPEASAAPISMLVDLAAVLLAAGTAVTVSLVRQRQHSRLSALSRLASWHSRPFYGPSVPSSASSKWPDVTSPPATRPTSAVTSTKPSRPPTERAWSSVTCAARGCPRSAWPQRAGVVPPRRLRTCGPEDRGFRP